MLNGAAASHARAGDGHSHDAGTGAGVVGPNAILQAAKALRLAGGPVLERSLFETAGLVAYASNPPTAMVPERHAAALFDAIRRHLSPEMAKLVMTGAGEGTAAYILAHRIPAPAKKLLTHLPEWLAARLLLMAIGKHAWTFCGSGRVICDYGAEPGLTLLDNPLAEPGCPWHVAVLTGLFREIVSPRHAVRPVAIGADDGRNMRFAIVRI